MRRRITGSVVAVVAVALMLSGVVSLLLAAGAERRTAESDVAKQANALAADANGRRVAVLQNAARLLKLSDLRLVVVGPLRINGALPAGVTAADLDPAALRRGETVKGRHRNIVFAAAPVTTSAGSIEAFVLTRRVPRVPGGTGYFLISALLAVALAAVVGDWVSRRIAGPLREAETVTARVAAGDLDARVHVPPRTDEELASLAASINTMADGLARARGLERQFLMSVSHELRTPLTSIRGFAEAISDGVAPDAPRAGAVIAAESRRLERLVQDLLDLAKLDARQFSLTTTAVPLGTLVLDTAEAFRPAAESYGLALTVVATEGAPLVWADGDRLAQVVANLCENALKYARTTVTVRVPESPSPAVIVEDDGPGIPADELPLVFTRLHTSSNAAARQIGSGLGLAIVSELVAAMNGTVTAESPISAVGGTRMRITVPPA